MNSCQLDGRKIVVTAGGTREPIDAVRYIGNRSSGKMGFALAQEAHTRGADVILISTMQPPASVVVQQLELVSRVAEMRESVLRHYDTAAVLIMAAAVSDFRVKDPSKSKIKKGAGVLTLQLVENEDFLLELDDRAVKIGFAAETESLLENARAKLLRKGLSMICANDVSRSDAGFEVDTNQVSLIYKSGEIEHLPLMTKIETASAILDRVSKVLE